MVDDSSLYPFDGTQKMCHRSSTQYMIPILPVVDYLS
jgi:hypothetical protein